MKIAIFGGSFDPPHIGHDAIVKFALKELDISKLLIIPTWRSPFKDGFSATPKQRFEWVKILWQDLGKVEVLDYEIKQERQVTSYESVKYIKEIYNPSHIYLIIGADNFKTLPKWNNYEELKQEVEFVVASRDGRELPKNLKKLPIHVNISSSNLREFPNPSFLPASIRDEVLRYYK